jgi:hypothetical protein
LQHNTLVAKHNIERPEVWQTILALADKDDYFGAAPGASAAF